MKHVTQEERLDYLVEAFKADSGKYKDIETPKYIEGNQIIAFEAIDPLKRANSTLQTA